MTTEEKNKIIAEYMGLTEDEYPSNTPKWWSGYGDFMKNDVGYHKSFDWIMPVGRKVKEELLNSDQFDASRALLHITKAATTFDITDLYNACYEAILFINKTKGKTTDDY